MRRTVRRAVGWLCVPVAGWLATGCQTDVRKAQYFSEGMYLYEQHCLNCHGADGAGLGRLYPPLAGADYLMERRQEVICGIRWGMHDTLRVNGVVYTQPMPAFAGLRPIEIAEIVTYIQNGWGNQADMTTVADVEAALRHCEPPQP